MKKSKLGYKRYSPDVNRSYNVIPSNRITMRDVDFPVYGIDDLGYAQMMYPGVDYEFPGSQVFELPVRQTGGQRDVMYTPNPNDPRLKAYADSLALYDRYKEFYNQALNTNAGTREQVARRYPIQQDPKSTMGLFHLVGTNSGGRPQFFNMYPQNINNVNPNILPIAARSYADESTARISSFLAEYKKPVQPVEYREVSKAVVKPKELLLDINFPESKVKRTTRLPESIDSIKYDASGINVYLTINGKTSIIPKKDYPSWRMENKDLYDAYTAKLAYGGEQLPIAQAGLNWRDVAPRPDNSERRDATYVANKLPVKTPPKIDPRSFPVQTVSRYKEPSTATKVLNTLAKPVESFGYSVRGERMPDNVGSSSMDMALDMINPFAWVNYARKSVNDLSEGNFVNAGFNALGAIPAAGFADEAFRVVNQGRKYANIDLPNIRRQLPGSPNAASSVDDVFNSKLEGLVNRESPVLTRNFNAAEFTDDMRGLRMENRILDNDFYQARNTKHFSASGAGAATGSGDYNTTFIGNIDDLRKSAHLRDVSPTDTYFYNPGDKFNLPNEGVFITSDPKVYEKLTNAGKTVKLDADLFSDAGNANLEKYLTRDRGDVLKSFDNYLANPDNRGSLIPSLYPNKKEAFASSWNSSAAHSYDILNTLESPASLLSNFRNPIIKEQWAKLPASAQQFELKKLNDYYKNNVLTGKISKDNLLNYDLKTYQKQYKEILENLAEQSASSIDDVGKVSMDEIMSLSAPKGNMYGQNQVLTQQARLLDPKIKAKFFENQAPVSAPQTSIFEKMPKDYNNRITPENYDDFVKKIHASTDYDLAASTGKQPHNLGVGNYGKPGMVYKDAPLNNLGKDIIAGHEKNHGMFAGTMSKEMRDDLLKPFGTNKPIPHYATKHQGDEVFARMAQFKNAFGIENNQTFTLGHLNLIRKNYAKNFLDNGITEMLSKLKPGSAGEKEFLINMNKYAFTTTGAVMGAGAAYNEFQNGGEQLQTPQPFIRSDFFTSQQIEQAKQNVLGNLPFGNSRSNPQESTYFLPVRPVEFAAINQDLINQKTVQRAPEKTYQPATVEDRFYEAVTKNTDELAPDLDNLYFMNYNSKNKDSVKAIQKKLADKGYYADSIDGYFGPNTKQAYNKYLSEKVNTDLSGVKFEVPQSIADKRCAAGICSILEQNDVQTGRLGLKYSNAWDILENMQSAGNSQTLYNIYDNPKFKEIKTGQELKEATREVKKNSQTKAQDYKVGDIVGLYWPESNEHSSTLNSKTHNTHIGFVSNFDLQGRPIISHNVSGRVFQQPYDQLVTTWISRPNNSGLLTERYKADEYVNTPVSYDKIRNFESKIGRKLGDNEVKTVSNVMRRARYSAQNLAKSLESSVNKNWLESAVFSITGVETAAGLNAPRTIENTGLFKRAAYAVKDKDPQTVSLGVGKTKLSSLDPFAKSYLDINSEKDLADDNKAVDAITYVLIKNYETFKDYASQYLELGLTEDDVRNMTILSYNQGTSKLLNVGRNPNVPVDEQIANLRRLYNSDNKIYDVSSSNYRFIPGGKRLQQIFEKPAEPYIAKANRYASEVYRKYGGEPLQYAQVGAGVPQPIIRSDFFTPEQIRQALIDTAKKAPLSFEDRINKALGNSIGKAADFAESVAPKGEGQVDNVRHTVAGMYTADAIANRIAPSSYGPTVLPAKVAGFIGSNLAGLAHEIKEFTPSLEGNYRNIPATARMTAEDMINNFVGSALFLNPFMSEKEKEDLIVKLSNENYLPDGYVQIHPNHSKDLYFKKEYGGDLEEFASGGLKQWFAEKWVDVKTGKDCGRSGKDRDGRPYPACRPSRRVNSTTPKTASEMSSSEKARFKREKTSGQRISYNHSRKQRGGQMSGSVGYDSMYNSPIAAFRYMMNPKDESKYYGEVYGTKQGPGIAAGIDYDNQKYGTQGMVRLGVDPLRGASIRAQGGKRFNPIDNRREELSYGPYGGVNFQTNDYVEFDGTGNQLDYNNLRPRLTAGANAEYNRELANRGRFSIEGDLGVGIGNRYGSVGEFQAEPYGAVKATYSLPMYNKNTKKKPSPTTYSPRGYQLGGQMTPQGITPAFFTGMKDATVDAFKSFMSSPDQPMQPTQPEAMDWRKMKRPAQIKYGIDQVVNLELEDKRRALENLLESTAYMENKYGEDPNAYGRKYTSSFMSIDPIALKDMFTGRGDKGRYNNAQKAQFENFKKLGLPVTQDEFDSRLREDDPVAAMAAARFRYALVPEALPNMNNSKAMYDYWLKYYNGNGVLKHQSKEKAYKTFLKGYKLALKND